MLKIHFSCFHDTWANLKNSDLGYDFLTIAGVLWQLSNSTAVKVDSCQKKVVSLTAVRFPVQEFWQLSDWKLSVLTAVDLTAIKTPVQETWQLSSWLLFSDSCQSWQLYYLTAVSGRLLYFLKIIFSNWSEKWNMLRIRWFVKNEFFQNHGD